MEKTLDASLKFSKLDSSNFVSDGYHYRSQFKDDKIAFLFFKSQIKLANFSALDGAGQTESGWGTGRKVAVPLTIIL